MSSSDGKPVTRVTTSQGALRVEAADTGTELSVVDSSFRVVARGVGRLEAALPAGIYSVRSRTGGQEDERFVVIEPEPVRLASRTGNRVAKRTARRRARPPATPLNLPAAAFGSPVPLVGTFAPEPHVREAERESRVVHAKKGQGSRIFVCVRDEPRPGSPVPYPDLNPAAGLLLHDLKGALIADFEQLAARGAPSGAPWAACTIELDPGAYLLTVDTPDARLRHTVIASPGWDTEVFLLLTSYAEGAAGRRADLPDAAFLLSRSGFDPANPEARQAELARLRLRDRQARERMREQPRQPWSPGQIEQPMLLLLKLHGVLLQGPLDEARRRTMQEGLARLRSLLGDHPDVEALATRIEPARTPPPRFEVPPMLLASWGVLNEEAKTRPELIPSDSLLNRVATRLWGQGPALVWREPTTRAGIPAIDDPRPVAFAALAPALAASLTATGDLTVEQWGARLRTMDLEAARARRDLDAYERAAVDHLAPGGDPRPPPGPAAAAETLEQRLVRALDVPATAVARVLRGLALKLTRPPPAPP